MCKHFNKTNIGNHRNMFHSLDMTSRPFWKRRQAKSLASADSRTVGDDIRLKLCLWDHLQHVQRKLPLLGFFTGTLFWGGWICWKSNQGHLAGSCPNEQHWNLDKMNDDEDFAHPKWNMSYERVLYIFFNQTKGFLDTAHMLMFTGPRLCVCVLCEVKNT